jgi:hypothetical protein
MGLTIHYNFSLPRKFTFEQAKAKVEALRQRCLDLPFKEVGELLAPSKDKGDNMSIERFLAYHGPLTPEVQKASDEAQKSGLWDLLHGTTGHINWTFQDIKKNFKWIVKQLTDRDLYVTKTTKEGLKTSHSRQFKYGAYETRVMPLHAIGFFAWPGEGCESMDIGIGLLPETVTIEKKTIEKQFFQPFWAAAGQVLKTKSKGWSGRGFCKTQYANDPRCGGMQNFIRCHLLVVAALDAAKELGFGVEVTDEGNFWQNRNVEALVKEIGQWDKILAAMFGAFQGAAEKTGMKVESPLQGRPDFERLEHEGLKAPEAQAMAKLFNAVKAS